MLLAGLLSRSRALGCVLLAILALGLGNRAAATQPLVLVVLDPLAKELACACVKGYGQRDYRKLAAHLESTLHQPVAVEFSDDLAETLKFAAGPEVIIVGERSRVRAETVKAKVNCRAVCELTDPEGSSSLTASFIVQAKDPAKELKDLSGRKILLGLTDTAENQGAVREALEAAGVAAPAPSGRSSYSEAALDVLDSSAAPLPVAVVPSYAVRLLEGCGSVKPGEIRVIGKTGSLPFVTVFTADAIPESKRAKIIKALLEVKSHPKLLEALESRDGFQPVTVAKSPPPQAAAPGDWPDWRGPNRDGRVTRLPARLPATTKFVWRKAAMSGGLAGLSVSGGRLLSAERDLGDENDVYRCLDAATGELLWRVAFPARGSLDYGQSPRATPVMRGDRAFLLGAFGDLRCVRVTDGQVLWHRQLIREFQAELPTWGMCSPPLIVDDLLIVNPGASNASLVALDCATGQTRWTTPGRPAAYAAFLCGEFGGRRQIVGYDQQSFGGWDVSTGQRLWELVPPTEGDFNVPTPIAVNGGVLLATENNGTRLYGFDETGRIIPKPKAEFADLAPDTATPVVTHGRVFGAHLGLRCLDLQQALRPVWHREDDALGDYATLLADDARVLVVTIHGELILLDARAEQCTVVSRLRIFDSEVEMYAHPALAGTRLFVRGGYSIACVDLETESLAN